MMEAALVIDLNGNVIHRHAPSGRTGGSLPDSRDLWDVIWENRMTVWGVAHTHPGSGVPHPSHTDITTFAAIEAALGRRCEWWIASSECEVVCRHVGPGRLDYTVVPLAGAHKWLPELYELSGIVPVVPGEEPPLTPSEAETAMEERWGKMIQVFGPKLLLLRAILDVWEKAPDTRLGLMIGSAAIRSGQDLFLVEDEDLARLLRGMVKK